MPERMRCRGCHGRKAHLVVDLGAIPPSDLFPPFEDPGPDGRWPLRLFVCPDCALVQLGPDESPAEEQPTHVVSATATEHARASTAAVVTAENLSPGRTFVEFDSGHGGDWIGDWMAHGLVPSEPGMPAHLVADVHHLMHAADLGALLDHHVKRVERDGVLVCEFFHALPMVENMLVDTVRHGHYSYLTVHTFARLLADRGMTVTSATMVPSYGGSVRVTARHASTGPEPDAAVATLLAREEAAGATGSNGVEAFGRLGSDSARRFHAALVNFHSRGLRVVGYGAPSKAAVLLSLADVDTPLLQFTADLSPAKHGRRVAGTRIAIRPVAELVESRPDVVVVLTWDIAEEVRRSLAERRGPRVWDPVLYVPLPTPRRLSLD